MTLVQQTEGWPAVTIFHGKKHPAHSQTSCPLTNALFRTKNRAFLKNQQMASCCQLGDHKQRHNNDGDDKNNNNNTNDNNNRNNNDDNNNNNNNNRSNETTTTTTTTTVPTAATATILLLQGATKYGKRQQSWG